MGMNPICAKKVKVGTIVAIDMIIIPYLYHIVNMKRERACCETDPFHGVEIVKCVLRIIEVA